MIYIQAINEAVDIASWDIDQEYPQYPEGARDKTLIYCPAIAPYRFLKENSGYLFKLSSQRYIEQYWVEIFAYRLGLGMKVPVPPTFASYNSQTNQSAALIEWYLTENQNSISGGDYCQQYIPNFDRKKGEQHNFETLEQIFSELSKNSLTIRDTWKDYWAKTLTFDALIGNTDRHQDNWCIIVERDVKNKTDPYMSFAPVFDNGTSMGHEILNERFSVFDDPAHLEKYVQKGTHHMKWKLIDSSKAGHLELLKNIANMYPETRQVMIDCLKAVNYESFSAILHELVSFKVPNRLTEARANFMLKLIDHRHRRLLIGLEN